MVTRLPLQRRRARGKVLQRESEQLHGLLHRLREHLKEAQDRAFEFVAALSFATIFVSGMFSIDGLSTVPPTRFGRDDHRCGARPGNVGWKKLQTARRFKVWQAHGLHRQVDVLGVALPHDGNSLVPSDALRLFFRAQDGHPQVSKSKWSRLSPGPPRAGFSLSRCLFRFSIRAPARIVDFIDVLYDFGSARGARCVHFAMCIETPVIIGCVRACGQILGIPLEIAFEHLPERRKLVSPGRHITHRMHNFRTHAVIPKPISQAPLIERIALLGPRPRPLWVRRQSGKEIDGREAGGVARLLKR